MLKDIRNKQLFTYSICEPKWAKEDLPEFDLLLIQVSLVLSTSLFCVAHVPPPNTFHLVFLSLAYGCRQPTGSHCCLLYCCLELTLCILGVVTLCCKRLQ